MRNKLTGMMMLAVAALGLIGCSDKLADESNGLEGNESYVYMNVAVALPSASTTRSGTEADEPDGDGNDMTNSDEDSKNNRPDYEYGYKEENKVSNLIFVIASVDNEFITSTPSITISESDDNAADAQKNNFTTEAQKFSRSDISAAYGKYLKMNSENKYLARVFVFCNPTTQLITTLQNTARGDKTWFDLTNEDKDDLEKCEKIWEDNRFLMSNAKIKTVEFPSLDGWNAYTTASHPFSLSTVTDPVYVERTAARFDFKDGSPTDTEANTYNVTIGSGENEKNVLTVTLTEMSLVNMSKEYHYLRRVSDDGTDNAWSLCGAEHAGNYVVDTDWNAKKNGSITEITEADYFHYPLFTTDKAYNTENWDTYSINTVLGGKSDLWQDKSYHIWRYVTENTIPESDDEKDPYSLQKTVQSVGVVFKGKIGLGDDASGNLSESVIAAFGDGENKPTLYLYNGILYAGLDELVEKAKTDGETSALYIELNKVFAHWVLNGTEYKYSDVAATVNYLTVDTYEDNHEGVNESSSEFKKELTDKKIVTMYEAEDGGYYCYYFYWNRHNDNLNNSVMHKMEFATVRNNVYKLSVTKINQLGHPTDPENDPDPVDPEDPDEEDDVYMNVTVEVLPWVVRVNDIEF